MLINKQQQQQKVKGWIFKKSFIFRLDWLKYCPFSITNSWELNISTFFLKIFKSLTFEILLNKIV